MKKYMNQFTCAIIALLLALSFSACKKAEQYYKKLDAQPEVRNEYQTVYGIGDTLILDGRLNAENQLEIKIGGVKAEIASLTKIQEVIDRAKIIITSEMGIGPDRPITISSGGNVIQIRSIEIIESSAMGQLPGPVKWQRVTSLSRGTMPLFCLNGKGTVFFWTVANSIIRIAKDGTSTQMFDGNTLTDNFGSFTINAFNAGGVDPSEQYAYFSAITTDGNADNVTNDIYRLCRIDLQKGQLTTLNRSVLPKTNPTQASMQPYEGLIGNVKIFQVTGIYPDRKGNVYVQLSQEQNAMAKLAADGRFKYLLNYNNNPQSNNPLPGVKTRQALEFPYAIYPDEGLLYARLQGGTVSVSLFDLNAQAEIYTNNFTYWSPVSSIYQPYISGTFAVLTLPSQSANLALPGKRLLNFYNERADRGVPATMGLLNFNLKRGERYAPGGIAAGIYTLSPGADQWLNYDEEGMIYGTANSKSVIVKTTYQ
jgi:hypothetical protein